MKKNFYIEISGFKDPREFVELWSKSDSFSTEWRYEKNIEKVLEDQDSFRQLFYWKNGTGEKFTVHKERVVNQFWKQRKVLLELRNQFNWERFEEEFSPSETSTIWKIFLLHLMNPPEFPIFDQNVYRFFRFIKDGIIKDPPTKKKEVYQIYKFEYRDWFNSIRNEYKLDYKDMDRSFFSFGRLLKTLDGKPIEIRK